MRIKEIEEENPEVQMAPLIDCVFLLLIFFLVATTLKKIDKELPLDLPVSAAAIDVATTDELVIISIDREGKLYLGSDPADIGYLHKHLQDVAKTDPNRRIRIDGDREAPLRAVVSILDLCNFEGLKNVRIKSKTVSPAQRAS